jgi:ubiquinone/menaquinone biosynthesis C-methylase UbiE
MNKAEFDQFAKEYQSLHATNIRASGETPDFFAEYKIIDLAKEIKKNFQLDSIKILDFGSGVGNSVPYFSKHIKAVDLTCVDVSDASLSIAQARHPDLAKYVGFDGKTLPFADESFSVVFTACVFHHIPAVEHILLFKEIYRILNKEGVLVVFEHNPLNPLTVQAVNTCEFDQNAVLIRASTLKQRLSLAGFKDIKCAYRIFFPRVLKFFRAFEPLLRWLPIGAQYYVSGKK